MTTKEAQEIAEKQISIEFNLLEEESLWQNPSSRNKTQYNQLIGELQITLQEMIDMINEYSQELSGAVKYSQKLSEAVKYSQEFSRAVKYSQKLSKAVKNSQELSEGIDD